MKMTAASIALLAGTFAFTSSAFAGAEISATYKASADELWQLVEFHQKSENIMPPVEVSQVVGTGVGARKLNTLKNGKTLELQLVYFNPDAKSFNYVIRQTPAPLKNYVGEVSVKDLGDGRAQLSWKSVFDPDGVEQAKADEAVQNFYKGIVGKIGEKFPQE